MLPFIAEPIDKLKARFPKAIEKAWEITDPMPDRPGLHREHLFDFESGLRLLISKDVMIPRKPDIHVSASWEMNPPKSLAEMHVSVLEGYVALGGTGRLRFIGMSGKGIPHWVVV